jgi:hypothetical protein
MVTTAHRVEVEVCADGLASAPPSWAAAAALPVGAYNIFNRKIQPYGNGPNMCSPPLDLLRAYSISHPLHTTMHCFYKTLWE